MELSTFQGSAGLSHYFALIITDIEDFTDSPARVSLITSAAFTESEDIDETTIPADDAHFNQIISGTPLVQQDETGRFYLLFPPPVGGWQFTSTGTGYPITVYGYRVDCEASGNFLGCKRLENMTFTGTGQTHNLDSVQLRIKDELIEDPGVTG